MKRYNTVLTVAGSDSGGGAGIQADIKTISACGCYATSAITSVTVQNTLGVHDTFGVPASVVAAQMNAVLDDIGADAVKIGMLNARETLLAVYECLAERKVRNIVLDTVFISTSGRYLLQPDAIDSLREKIFPLCRILTPNIPEAETIMGNKISSVDDMKQAARFISDSSSSSLHPVSVLLKGGHCTGDDLTDVLFCAETCKYTLFRAARIDSVNTHGTGCTLSSAIASFLAKGFSLTDAVTMAKKFVDDAIRHGAGYEIGKGTGPLNHLFLSLNEQLR